MTADPTAYVNAYWSGDTVVLLRRDANGRLLERRVPAEYSFFLRVEDLAKEILDKDGKKTTLGRSVRASRRVKEVREEGVFARVLCADSDFRYATCRGGVEGSWFARYGVEAYEADVHPVRRFLIESRCAIQKPRKVWFDMETDSRVPFSRKEDMRILCWSLTFEDGRREAAELEHDTDADERALLLELVRLLEEVDCVIAWNGGEGPRSRFGFDFPLLAERCKRRGIKWNPNRWLWLDAMLNYEKYNMHSAESGDEKESLALERIAEAHGIDTSEKTSVEAAKSWELWEAGGESRDALVRRCIFDSWSMREIERKTGYVDLHYSVCQTSGCFPDTRSLRALVHVEAFLMRLAAERGLRFPSKWGQERQERRDKFEGAFVLEPTRTGILRNVHVCDFSGMYPSIIQSWNMSPEAYCEELSGRPGEKLADVANRLPPGHAVAPRTLAVFRTDVEGILSIAIGTAKGVRKKWNKIRDASVPNSPEWLEADRLSQGGKISVNSFFGVASSPFSRFFKREVGESITTTGSWLIKATMRLAEERGIKALAGDTDSTFAMGVGEAAFRAFKDDCNRELYPRLLAECRAPKNVVELDYEKEFDLFVITEKKKRYAGRFAHYKGQRATLATEPVIKGFEYKRGDSLRITRTFQKQVIDKLLLIGEEIPAEYPLRAEDFFPIVEEWKTLVLEGDLTLRDVTVSKSLSKDLDEYAVRLKKDGSEIAQPQHVQIARALEERGEEIAEGVRIRYVVTDGTNRPMKAVPASDYVPGSEDRGYYWASLVFPPVQRILEACFPETRWERFLELPNRGGGRGRSKYGAGQEHFDFFWQDRKRAASSK